MDFITAEHSRFLPKNEFKKLIEPSFSLPPSIQEVHLQKLWFEGWFTNPLQTSDGASVSIIQTGFWNHGAGPDFTHAAYRDPTGKVYFGAVEVHREASDWERHGHHLDLRYEEVILHLVWKSSAHPTRTRSGKIIPQIEISRFLTIETNDLPTLFPEQPSSALPTSKPGLCHQTLLKASEESRWKLVEEAGWLRLLQKSRRLFLRQKMVGSSQSLWESLAEGCGYSRNTLPFRALAQRVRVSDLIGLPASLRKSILLGIAGFLPQERHLQSTHSRELRLEAQSIWEQWWRAQSLWSHFLLPPQAWTLHGIRPWNRPERRIAALARLIPRLRSLKEHLQKGRRLDFQRELSHLHDPFWETHPTWNAKPQKPSPLIGAERLGDLEINLYWVWQIMEHGIALRSQLRTRRMTPNQKTQLAWQRIGGSSRLPLEKQTVLFQQGLIALLQDFCFHDTSNCLSCPFPKMILNHRLQEKQRIDPLDFENYQITIQNEIQSLEELIKKN